MIWVLFSLSLILGAVCLGKSMAKENNVFNTAFFGAMSTLYFAVAIFIVIGVSIGGLYKC